MRRGRRGGGARTRTPLPALLVLLLASGLLVPLFVLSISEDVALSGSTTGRQLSGGEQVTSTKPGRGPVCRDAPVEYEVAGRPYQTTTFVAGECVARGEVEPVTIRYLPDDPERISTNSRQYLMYGFLAAAALGFVATLVVLLRRWRGRLAARRSAAQGPGGAVSPR